MISLDVEIGAGGGPGGGTRVEQVFTPTLGQTVFTLSGAPLVANDTSMFINSVKYIYGQHYTVAGTALTFIPAAAGFTLDALDKVEAIYFV